MAVMYRSNTVFMTLCETSVAVNMAGTWLAYPQHLASRLSRFQASEMTVHGNRDITRKVRPQMLTRTMPTMLKRRAHVPLSKMRRNWKRMESLIRAVERLRLMLRT